MRLLIIFLLIGCSNNESPQPYFKRKPVNSPIAISNLVAEKEFSLTREYSVFQRLGCSAKEVVKKEVIVRVEDDHYIKAIKKEYRPWSKTNDLGFKCKAILNEGQKYHYYLHDLKHELNEFQNLMNSPCSYIKNNINENQRKKIKVCDFEWGEEGLRLDHPVKEFTWTVVLDYGGQFSFEKSLEGFVFLHNFQWRFLIQEKIMIDGESYQPVKLDQVGIELKQLPKIPKLGQIKKADYSKGIHERHYLLQGILSFFFSE